MLVQLVGLCISSHTYFTASLWLIVFGVDMLKRWLVNHACALAQACVHIKVNSRSVGNDVRVAVLLTLCLHVQRIAQHRSPGNKMLPTLALTFVLNLKTECLQS